MWPFWMVRRCRNQAYLLSSSPFPRPYCVLYQRLRVSVYAITCFAEHLVQQPDVEAHLFLRMDDIGKPVSIQYSFVL